MATKKKEKESQPRYYEIVMETKPTARETRVPNTSLEKRSLPAPSVPPAAGRTGSP